MMEDELDNAPNNFRQIIFKEKRKELFALPCMKSDKLSTKAMKGIKIEEKLEDKDINLERGKQLSDSTFDLYGDTSIL